MAALPDYNDEQLTELLEKSELPVAVDFWSSHCNACYHFNQLLEQAVEKYKGKLVIVKIDASRNKLHAGRIKATLPTPTTAIYFKGKLVETNIGAPLLIDYFYQFVDRVLLEVEHIKIHGPKIEIPKGYKLLRDTTQEQRSFPGDSHSENGSYMNECCHCLRMFLGHKRRVTCRACQEDAEAEKD